MLKTFSKLRISLPSSSVPPLDTLNLMKIPIPTPPKIPPYTAARMRLLVRAGKPMNSSLNRESMPMHKLPAHLLEPEQQDGDIDDNGHQTDADLMICQKIDQGGQAGNASAYNSVADEKAIHTDRVQCASDQHGCKADTFSHDNLFRLFLHFRKNAPSFPFYFVLKLFQRLFCQKIAVKTFLPEAVFCLAVSSRRRKNPHLFLELFRGQMLYANIVILSQTWQKRNTLGLIFCLVSFRLYIKTTGWKDNSCKRKEKCNYPTSKERKSKKRNPIV